MTDLRAAWAPHEDPTGYTVTYVYGTVHLGAQAPVDPDAVGVVVQIPREVVALRLSRIADQQVLGDFTDVGALLAEVDPDR